MKTRLIAALLVAATASVAAPAFASGYGPAPHYQPTVGAPASQQGVNAQTIAAERSDRGTTASYGGVAPAATQSGATVRADGPQSVYFGK